MYKFPYLIEGWVVSSESVVYSDTELYKVPRWKTMRMLDSRTHNKPSSLGVPLSPLSSHPNCVHNWWPLDEIRRFVRRSTQQREFIRTRNRSIERLVNYDGNKINQKSWVRAGTWSQLREGESEGSNDVLCMWASSCSVLHKRTRSDWKMEPNLVWSDQAPQYSESQSRLENWMKTFGCAPEVERSTCHPESAQSELSRSKVLRGKNLSDLTGLGRRFIFIFFCPWAFLPCPIASDLHVSLGPTIFCWFCWWFFVLSFDSERCAHELGSRSPADQLCQKSARILTLPTSAHLIVAVVSMSVRSVGVEVFSPVGMARAATIPVGALEAGHWMGETPRGQKARDAEPAEQTPDQKAEEIVKKTLDSNLERRCSRTWKGLRPSSSISPTNWSAQEGDTITLHRKFHKFNEGTCHLESNLFSIPGSEELDNQAPKNNCGTLVLEPEGTWRDMKKFFTTSSGKRHWHLKHRWRTITWKNWSKLWTSNRSWKNGMLCVWVGVQIQNLATGDP